MDQTTAPDLATFVTARLNDLAAAGDLHTLGCGAAEAWYDPDSFGTCDCHNPAHVLREVTAMRAIVEDYRVERGRRDAYQADDARAVEERAIRRRSSAARCRGLETAVEHLATIWDWHADYRAEWAP